MKSTAVFLAWSIRRVLASLAAGVAAAALSASALAQSFPVKPVRFVVPYSAGGAPDIVMRMLGDSLSRSWGQPVLIDNRPGAGGIIGMNEFKKGAPDGYTYAFAEVGVLAINPLYYRQLPYDPEKDFVPVADLISNNWILFTSKDSPIKSVRGLIDYAKANPGRVTFASPGTGTPIWGATELLKLRAGIDMLHVPFKEVSLMINSVASGEVTLYFTTMATMQPVLSRVTPLGISSRERSPVFPQVPTIAEEGGPAGFEVQGWAFLIGLRGTPPAALEKVRVDTIQAMNRPEISGKLRGFGLEVSKGMTREDMQAFIRSESERYRQVITATGARGEL